MLLLDWINIYPEDFVESALDLSSDYERARHQQFEVDQYAD